MTITVYGPALSPFVRKVRVALAEKGVPYELKNVNIFQPPEWFVAISPLKRVPVMRDDSEGADAILPDSSAICGYLERKHPNPPLYPSEPFAYGRALWFEEYGDSEFVSTCGMGIFRPVVLNKFMGKDADYATAKETWDHKIPRFLDYLEKEIGTKAFLVGDRLTVADIAVATPFVNVAHSGFTPDAKTHPNLVRYLKAIHARPSFAAVIAEEAKVIAPLGIKAA
jgi:glutathione S-transferase